MAENRSKSDGFMLRFPPGLRDRVKAGAEARGRSMNAEIVRVLEKEFPEPWSLATRVSDMLGLLEGMKAASGDEIVDTLSHKLLQTVEGIASGRVVDVEDEQRTAVREILEDYWQAQAEGERDRLDDSE